MKGKNITNGLLIGNKKDLDKNRIVNKIDAIRLSYSLGLEYLEISALTGENVETTFQKVASKLLNSSWK
jgi:Fe2+ transport system protein B